MVLFKTPLNLPTLVVSGILLFFSVSSWADSSDNLLRLKDKMSELQTQIAQEELKGKNLALKESQLTKKINALKKDAQTKNSLILSMRIENSLKELRENLIAHQENENRRSLLQEQIAKTKLEMDAQMESEINRLILSAQQTFRKGNEKQSDQSYQAALHLMEERKQIQTETIPISPALPSFAEFVMDGKESLEKLKEAADFGIQDLEFLNKEIKLLEGHKNRTAEEISLRKNLVKYQGLLERGDNVSPLRTDSIEKEIIQLEKEGKIIENKLIKIQEAKRTLSRKIRKIERMIQTKQP